MTKPPSVISRFRLTGLVVILAIGLVGAAFYAFVHSVYLGALLSRTLGPYSDSLAEHGFASPDLAIWGRIAERHSVVVVFEPVDGTPLVFGPDGEPRRGVEPGLINGSVRAERTAEDGRRAILYWPLLPSPGIHLALLGSLLVMVVLVVGSAFWFLNRQLGPLNDLQAGVEALAEGDLGVHVPVVRDDEIGRVTRAFNGMATRVGDMIEDRERWLGDVSHELRSPIARMKVAGELLPDGPHRHALQRDLREMEELVAALLERQALRSRSGAPSDDRSDRTDLVAVTQEIAAPYRRRRPGVEVRAPGEATVEADPHLMALLVRNLVDNAVKFSLPDSGPVEVEIHSTEDTVTLCVADDGPGIPPGEEARVLEPFVKLDDARGHHAGYGLGLDLCRRIADSSGGTLELLRRRPRGTAATVTLPRGRT